VENSQQNTLLMELQLLRSENKKLKEAIKQLEHSNSSGSTDEAIMLPKGYSSKNLLDAGILDTLPHRIFVKNTELTYIACNQLFAKDLGVSPDAIVGKNDFDLYPTDMASMHQKDDLYVMTTGNAKDYTECLGENGSKKWFRTVKSPLHNHIGDIVGVVGVFEDVTMTMEATDNLRNSQELLSVTLNSIGDGVITTDNLGRVVYLNPVAEKLCGWNLKDAIGLPLIDVFHIVNAFTRQLAENPVEQALKSGKVVGLANHTMLLSKDGNEYHIFDSAAPIKNSEGEILGVVMVFMDVTDKYIKEQLLAESEKRLRNIVECSTNTFYSHDLEGNLTYISPQIKDLLGYDVTEVFDNWTKRLSDNPINAIGVANTQRAIDTGETSPPYELEFIHKEGHKIWVEIREAPVVEDGKVIGIVGSNTNITKRKIAEQMLMESEKRLRNIVEYSTNTFYSHDVKGNLTYLSPQIKDLLGYEAHEIMGDWSKTLSDNPINATAEAITQRAIDTGEAPPPYELEFIHKAGHKVWAEIREAPVFEDGKVVGIVGSHTDITERKIAEQMIKDSENRFRSLFDQSYDAILLIDGETIVDCNFSATKMLNTPTEQIIGKSVNSFSPEYQSNGELSEKLSREIIEDAYNGIPCRFDWQFWGAESSLIHTEVAINLVKAGDRFIIRALIRDITQRKLAEQKLKEREEMLAITLNSIGDGMIATDNQGNVVNMNPVAEKMCGWSLNEATGKKITEIFNIVHETTRALVSNPILTVLETKSVVGLANHTSLLSRCGKEYNITDSAAPIIGNDGKMVGVIMVFSDVTEKYQKTKALRQSEEKLRQIIENSINVFYTHDANHKLTFISPQIYDLLGYTDAESLEDWRKFLSNNPINDQGIQNTILALETGIHQPTFLLELKHKTGRRITVEVRESPVVVDGKVVAIVGSFNDISSKVDAERRIKESEEKFRNIFDYSLDAILLMEGPTIIECNQSALRIFGCNPDQIVGHPIQNFCPESQSSGECSNSLAIELIEAANLGLSQHFEWLHQRMDGTLFNAEVSLNRIELQNKFFLQAIVRDITARKQAEEKLRVNEEKFRAILENMSEGVLLSDIEDSIIYANPQVFEMFGLEPDCLNGRKGYQTLVHPDDWDSLRNKTSLRLQGISDTYDVRCVKKSGEIFFARIHGAPIKDPHGNITGTVGIISDVTKQRDSEINIRILLTAIEQAPASIVVTDLKGNIKFVNRGFVELTGYTKDEALGNNPRLLKSGLHDHAFHQNLWQTLNAGETWYGEFINKKKDGTIFYEKATISPVYSPEGEIEHFIAVKEDITEQKKSAQEQYLRLDRRRKVAEVIAMIATSENLVNGAVKELAEELMPPALEILGVDYLGIWLFDDQFEYLENIASLSTSSGMYRSKTIYTEDAFKKEFDILRKNRYVDASYCRSDDRVAGYLEDYFVPNNIESTLDVAIVVNGVMLGVMSFEILHNTHEWQSEEISFAIQLADQMALALMHKEKKKAEGQIRLLSNAIEQSPISIAISNNNRIIEYVNARFIEQTGYSDIETIGKHFDFFHTSIFDADRLERLWDTVNGGKTWIDEILVSRKDGTTYWDRFMISPLFSSDGNISHFVEFRVDITRRKTAEVALKERERMFQTLINNLPGLVYRTSLDPDFKVNFISSGCFEITGYLPEEFLTDKINFKEIILPQYREPIWNKWQEVVANRSIFTYEYEILRQDGKTCWVWERGQPIFNNQGEVLYLEGYMEDVSERKASEEEITRSRDRLQAFFDEDISADYISTVKGSLVICNQTFVKLFGFESKEEAYACPVKNLYWSKHDRIHFLDCLNKDGKVENYRMKYRSKNNKLIHGLINAKGEFDSNGNLVQIRGYIVDITLQETIHLELIKARDKAEESNRLKSAFLANMSHEIRTPMNGILGFTDLIKEPDLSGDERNSFITIIKNSGLRLLKTVDDLINLSKIEAGMVEISTKSININTLLVELYTFFTVEANKKGLQLRYTTTLENTFADITTDTDKLHAILTNLISNAIKYTHKGFVEFGCFPSEKAIQFYVVDSGIGIEPARQSAVFERFVQADIENRHAYQGAGLGLAIAKSFVEILEGRIWVESTPDVGSKFQFTLPFNKITTQNTSLELPGSSAIRVMRNDRIKILIAEDDNTSVSLLMRTLKPIAGEILVAPNGAEAITIAKKNPDIKLILMDISMPMVNGYEATRQIRTFNKEVCIIAQTAFAMFGDKEKAIEAGCNAYISKPVKLDELKVLINKFLSNKHIK